MAQSQGEADKHGCEDGDGQRHAAHDQRHLLPLLLTGGRHQVVVVVVNDAAAFRHRLALEEVGGGLEVTQDVIVIGGGRAHLGEERLVAVRVVDVSRAGAASAGRGGCLEAAANGAVGRAVGAVPMELGGLIRGWKKVARVSGINWDNL